MRVCAQRLSFWRCNASLLQNNNEIEQSFQPVLNHGNTEYAEFFNSRTEVNLRAFPTKPMEVG
jgi:hypothetical protein